MNRCDQNAAKDVDPFLYYPGPDFSIVQRLEINDFNLTVVFQSFDGSAIPDSCQNNVLPWELLLAKNY